MISTLAALMLAAATPVGGGQMFVLSLTDLQLKPSEYVSGFSLQTWGVHVLATCRIPPGWSINAGSSASPDGTIEGDASLGVTFLGANDLKRLRQLALVTLSGPVQDQDKQSASGVAPATFSGALTVGTYGKDGQSRLRLDHRNVTLEPAARCPAPEPW